MVIYRGTDGKPGYHQTDDIHDAVGFVEELRNTEGVDHARIFRLEEVTFEYKPYYRVELGTAGTAIGASSDAGSDSAAGDDDGVAEVEAADDVMDDDGADGADVVEEMDEVAAEVEDDAADASANGEAVGSGTARRGLFGR